MRSSHEAELDIPGLSPAARKAHIFPDLAARSLISIGQSIELNGVIVLTGTRSQLVKHHPSHRLKMPT
jgi:hypothetical protein